MPLGKEKHLFPPHLVQFLPINYLGIFRWQACRVQHPRALAPAPTKLPLAF